MTALERIKSKIEKRINTYKTLISSYEKLKDKYDTDETLLTFRTEIIKTAIKQKELKHVLSEIDLEIQRENQARDEMLNDIEKEVLNGKI
jgi:hypothetical protein